MKRSITATVPSTLRIIVADDHPVFRYGLCHLLATQTDFVVIGEAANGDEAVRLSVDGNPTILLLDLCMPGGCGLSALRRLRDRPDIRTIVLTASIARDDMVGAFRLGARGVILKDAPAPLLFKCIRTVAAGEAWLGRQEVADVIEVLGAAPEETRDRLPVRLTPREREIIALVASARSNRDIARLLSVSEDTVKHHLTNIFDKVGVSNRVELTLFAQRHALVGNT